MIYLFLLITFIKSPNEQNDFAVKDYIVIEGPAIEVFYLPAGRYKVTLYGAQGGFSYSDGNYANEGGKGAKVSAYINIEGPPQLFYAYVGGMGGSRTTGLADGGFNGGGISGWNQKWKAHKVHNKQYKDGTGGGGGATDLRFGTSSLLDRIIVAGGGSGACAYSAGAPGGDLNGYNYWGPSERTTQVTGYSLGTGANGAKAKRHPSTGAGGGYFGGAAGFPSEGETASPVSDSGSSYISGYPGCTPHPNITLDSGEMVVGYKSGNGMLVIDVVYQCPDNCTICKGENQCTSCEKSFRLFNGHCLSSCPAGSIDRDYYCEKCDESCSECSEIATNCTICADNFVQYNNLCLLNCPFGTYEYENQCLDKCEEGTYAKGWTCEECSDKCKDCVDNPEKCTACPHDKYLLKNECVDSCNSNQFVYKNVCYDRCPKGTYKVGNTCEDCDSSCAECRDNATICTACFKDSYLINSQCILKCESEDYFVYHGQCLERCPQNTLISGKNCFDFCPEGKYEINKRCDDCDPSCDACINTASKCIKCKENKFLFNNKCIDECIDGTYAYLNECLYQCPPGTRLENETCTNSIELYNQSQDKEKKKKKHTVKILFGIALAILVICTCILVYMAYKYI